MRFIIALLLAAASVVAAQAAPATYPAPYTCQRNFFVGPPGGTGVADAAGCGTTQSNACATIQGANNNIALQGGDCVNVAAGTYNTNADININKGGSSNQATGYVTYKGAANHASKINYVSGPYYGFRIQANYVAVDGLEFAGNNATANAIFLSIDGNHHLIAINNLIHDSIGGNGTIGADYFLFAGNEIYNTALCTPYGQSGLSIFHPAQIPGFNATLPWDTQNYHIQVIGNYIHDNGRTHGSPDPPNGCPRNNDGEGIIFDDWDQQQVSGGVPYPYHGLIFGNLVTGNQGRGLQVGPSSRNADVYNNTSYNNGLNNGTCDPTFGCPPHDELLVSGSNFTIKNNILYSTNQAFSFGAPAHTIEEGNAYGEPDTGNVINNNLTWIGTAGTSGVVVSGTTNDAGNLANITQAASNNTLGADPQFNSIVNKDFHPQSTSPVIGAGAAIPTGVLPGPLQTNDGVAFLSPPNIGAFNTSAVNSVAGPISIAAGGSATAPYSADAGFNGGTGLCCGTWTTDTSLVTTTTPAPQIIYQGQRYGPSFFYDITGLVASQNYTVILHFTEDFDTAAGRRQENITINGTQVLTGLDIFSIAGAQHKAITRSFVVAADSTGSINVTFNVVTGLSDPNAKVDAIRVLAMPTAANQTASTPFQTAVTINLANGSTGSPLTAAVSGTPTGGTVAISGLNATFTPNAGFSGNASFQFTLSGDGGTSNIATASVTVGQPVAGGGPQPGHIAAPYSCLRTFYVATNGLDTNACSSSAPCASIQGAHNQVALQAGDCVSVGAGTYNTGSTINLIKGGNANSATGYVTYIGAPSRGSIINFNAPIVNGVTISGSYMIMDGFEFAGSSVVTGPAIIGGSYQTLTGQVHHAMILNSSIHDFGGAGIAFQSGDYYTLSGNLIYNNAWHSASGDNGLQIYEPQAIPGFVASLPADTQTYHIQVLQNVSHNNGCLRGDSNCTHGHGDGFAFQDFEGIQWQTGANSATFPCAYPSRSLVAGNLAYANGGRGFELSPNASAVDIFNNTSYGGGADPTGSKDEFILIGTNNNIYNNVFWDTAGGNTINFNNTGTAGPDTGNTFGYNLTFNGIVGQSGVSVTNTSNNSGYLAQITGATAHNQLGVAPAVTSVTTPDFHPLSGSPLLGAGGGSLASGYTIVTVDGNAFPNPTNIGGYNLNAVMSGLPPCTTATACFQYVPGLWYLPDKIFTSNGSTAPLGANIIRCVPAGMRSQATISNLATRVYNADSNGHVQFAIYTNLSARPATQVAASSTVAVGISGPVVISLPSNIQGGPGGAGFSDSFWLCANTDSNKATFSSTNALGSNGPTTIGSAISGNVLQQSGNGAVITSLSCSGAACGGGSSSYGSFPASLAGTTWTEETANKMPAAAFQIISVP